MIYIYAIICPITDNVVYIGKTSNIKSRFSAHLNNKKTDVGNWIQELKNNNKLPVFKILKRCYYDRIANEYEHRFMFYFKYFLKRKIFNKYNSGRYIANEKPIKQILLIVEKLNLK